MVVPRGVAKRGVLRKRGFDQVIPKDIFRFDKLVLRFDTGGVDRAELIDILNNDSEFGGEAVDFSRGQIQSRQPGDMLYLSF